MAINLYQTQRLMRATMAKWEEWRNQPGLSIAAWMEKNKTELDDAVRIMSEWDGGPRTAEEAVLELLDIALVTELG